MESITISDVDELQFLFRTWEARFTQLGRGAFRANLARLGLAGVDCRWGESNLNLHARCSSLTPIYSFSLVDEANAVWRRHGRRLEAGTVELTPPGGTRDVVTGGWTRAKGVSVADSTLHEAIEVLLRKDPGDVIPKGVVVRPAPSAFAVFKATLERTLEDALSDPGLLEEAQVLERYRSRCLVALCELLQSNQPEAAPPFPRTSRYELVREAEDLMDQNLSKPLSALQICRALCVSRRTFFYVFQELRGLAPMTYYRAKRLNRVRSELKASNPTETTVGEVARRWGFRHPGQFAKDYLQLFGERPSTAFATRDRTPERAG